MTIIREQTEMNDRTADHRSFEMDLLQKNTINENPANMPSYPLWFSKRLLILILLFCGFFFNSVTRVCVNIAIIEMTTEKTYTIDNETYKAADFQWNSAIVGQIQSSHFYGYIFSGLAGYLAVKFGGSVTYGISTMLLSLVTIMNPVFLQCHLYMFLAWRVIGGAFDGIAYGSSAEIFARWIPINERSTFMAILFGGVYVGYAAAYPLCGYVAYFWGWRMIFYVAGGSGVIWSLNWLFLAKNQPSKDRKISEKELLYISSSTETTSRKEISHPYKKIITSPAVWAMGVAKLGYSWGFSIIVITLPLYVKDVTHKEINEIGIISTLPNVFCIFMTPLVGASIDYLQNNHNLKASQIHKSLMTFGFVTSFILFGVASFSTNFILSMVCFILIKVFLSFNFLILQLICLYMAPKHSSVLLGLSATWFLLGQISVPILVGFIVVSHSLNEWSTCYMITVGALVITTIIYGIYGSSELQPWAMSTNTDQSNEKKSKDEKEYCELKQFDSK